MKITRTDDDIIARSWSFFWVRRIVVGRRFDMLPLAMRNAILAHEQGHVENRHVEKGLLCLLTNPWNFFKLCRKQELEADEFAATFGHALALVDFLRFEKEGNRFYPSHAERRQHLKQYEHTRFAPVKRPLARSA